MYPRGTKVLLKRGKLGGNVFILKFKKVLGDDDVEVYGILLEDVFNYTEYVHIGFNNGADIELYKYRVEFLDDWNKDDKKQQKNKQHGHALTKIFI